MTDDQFINTEAAVKRTHIGGHASRPTAWAVIPVQVRSSAGLWLEAVAEARNAGRTKEEKRASLLFPCCRNAKPEQWRPVVHELKS